ncbi:MAG: trypsin-like peptidase domain-containing protein [Microcella sp.]|uniref:S1C family serine protease n=1 Tax=Microcella sp. TaxID=1913979 RepID=UPI0024C89C7A|nr:trypsin-like peptidase domain-containing protein [Microcella sp.]UYN84805.1 MAG: trypsin-like peptidase domain-containing protein [Microcella sp.]
MTTTPEHIDDAAPEAPVEPAPEAPVETAPATPAPAPARTGIAMGPLLGMLAVGALIGGVAGGGVTAAVLAGNQSSVVGAPQGPTAITVNDPGDATLVTGVVATAMPSVVSLQVAGGGTAGGGSGVILSEDGYVLTNNHVATLEGATLSPSIRVSLSDGRIFNAELVGSDPLADLAVVKIEGAENLPVIEFADSDALNVGDRAIVIGAPLGLSGTVTNGIVSALNRSITVRSSAVPEQSLEQPLPPNDSEAPFDFWDFDVPGTENDPQSTTPRATISLPVIQTDAAINPGNSGGALLNDQGQLIGIVVALATTGGSGGGQAGSIGVGFSIPSNFALRVANELIENGVASHGLLGALVTDSINDAASTVVGALIDSVTPGGAADQVGLRSGDVITIFNGVPISSSVDLTAQVRVLAGGASTTLTYVRGGTAREVTVTLGELR